MKTLHKHYKVEKSRIGFLKFIFEAHDGIAMVTTLDPEAGLVRVIIAPGCEEETFQVIDELKKGFELHDV